VKVTKEMIDLFDRTRGCGNCGCGEDEIGVKLQAVLDSIDPVPGRVMAIRDGDGNLWRRSHETLTTWIRPGNQASVMDLIRVWGPITWEGKS
jgi:hypothetical protein